MSDRAANTGPSSLTPEERVARMYWLSPVHPEYREEVAAAIRAAVAEEREACLKILIDADGRHDAIDAIRARADQ